MIFSPRATMLINLNLNLNTHSGAPVVYRNMVRALNSWLKRSKVWISAFQLSNNNLLFTHTCLSPSPRTILRWWSDKRCDDYSWEGKHIHGITDVSSLSTYMSWVEQGLTSHQTHYRSHRGRVFTGQMTQPTVSQHWRTMCPKYRASMPSDPPHCCLLYTSDAADE